MGDRSYDALPSVRIRQFGSILRWAWPHVPCHTLGAIRDHYEFVFNMHISDASLATEELVVLQASGGLRVKRVKGINVKP